MKLKSLEKQRKSSPRKRTTYKIGDHLCQLYFRRLINIWTIKELRKLNIKPHTYLITEWDDNPNRSLVKKHKEPTLPIRKNTVSPQSVYL